MKLYFKTKRNQYGQSSCLYIDTERKVYCRNKYIIVLGTEIQIGKRNLNDILEKCLQDKYKEVTKI